MKKDNLKKFNLFNPNQNNKYLDYEKIIDGKRHYKLFSWILQSSSVEKKIIIDLKKYNNEYLSSNLFPYVLLKLGWNTQLYYDSVVLGLTDLKDRPKCSICGKYTEFLGMSHGYKVTCSKDCHSKLKANQISLNSGMTKKSEKVPESRKKKISKTLKSIPKEERFNSEWRRKHSEYMKSFAKTPEGIKFYEKVGRIVSENNIKKLKEGSSGLKSKLYKKGIHKSLVFQKEFRYDSGWELLFINYVENNYKNLDISIFDRCMDVVPYQWEDGSYHKYLPDFFIKLNSNKKLVIEIKPYYLTQLDIKTKLTISAGHNYFKSKDIKYIVLTEKDFLSSSGKKYNSLFNLLDYI